MAGIALDNSLFSRRPLSQTRSSSVRGDDTLREND